VEGDADEEERREEAQVVPHRREEVGDGEVKRRELSGLAGRDERVDAMAVIPE
jgi:hypothetical protein